MTTIHREGLKIILTFLVITAVLIFLVLNVVEKQIWQIVWSVLIAIPLVFFIAFFRYPKRQRIPGDKIVTSVADGTVVIVDKVYEDEYFHKEMIQVSVFMSVFNVHVNFWPLDGECTYYKYHPGKFLVAYLPKASQENEHTSVVVKNAQGQEIMFRQIAGMVARRVVSYAKPGEKVTKAKSCGVIKFGSRIDMFFPLDAKIDVEVDDEVRACSTIIAELS